MSEGFFRFLCRHCRENYNNINWLLTEGYSFRSAVERLQRWLKRYQSRPSQDA